MLSRALAAGRSGAPAWVRSRGSFAIAHAAVSYTPIGFVFLFVVAFPVGLVAGYLMRRTRGLLAPVIFHAGLDIAIYLAFLSYVSGS
jgi:membrane protease YdiL (CAAX protease family)